ncbi:MAG: hypothetical protein ABEJ42_00235 [Halobacteriaceae archaeon]
MRRTFIVLAMIALVALAGCSALPASSSGLSSVEYPEHASADGISDVDAFVSQMRSTLESEGYAMTITTEEANSSGTTSTLTVDLAVAGDKTLYEYDLDRTAGTDEVWGWYHDGDTGYRKTPDGVRQKGSFDWQSQTYDTLVRHLQHLALSASGTRSAGDRTLIVYDVTGFSPPSNPSRMTAEGEVVVDQQGVIHSVDVTFSDTQSAYRTHVTVELTLEDPEVTAPSWVPE